MPIQTKINDVTQQKKSRPPVASGESRESLTPLAAGIVAAFLVGAVIAVYSPALNFQFILDDHHFLGDPRLQSSGHIWEYFTSYVWAQVTGGPLSFYRPLFVLWLRLNYILTGGSPWGWHLLSVCKHLSVAVLLGLLVWKLLHDRMAALIAGTLFALHPAQTESVAWVSVPDPLMSAAVLGSLLLYLSYVERVSEKAASRVERLSKRSRQRTHKSTANSSVLWVVAAAAACLAALMAKETAIVLPVVLFATALIVPFDAAENGTVKGTNADLQNRLVSALRQTLPFWAVTVVYLLLRFIALQGHLSSHTQHLPWKTVLLSWPSILWFYVKVLFWPVRPRAFADPGLVDIFSFRHVLLPAAGVCCVAATLVAACLWAWKRGRLNLPDREAINVERALLFGIFLLVFPILLALNLNALDPGDFLHGRYTYLSLTGLMLLVATGWHLATRASTALLAAIGLVAVAFSILTVNQESMWKDDLTVYTVAHQIAPHNAPVAQNLVRAHVQVALGLDEADRCDEAVPIFQKAIQEYPQDWFAWAGLGECFAKLNDLPNAERSLHRASDLSREPRVRQEWEQVREQMGLPSTSPQ